MLATTPSQDATGTAPYKAEDYVEIIMKKLVFTAAVLLLSSSGAYAAVPGTIGDAFATGCSAFAACCEAVVACCG